MAGIITYKFRLNNAEQFYESFSEADPTRMYIFTARTQGWTNDASPPTPNDTVKFTNYDVWRNMLFAKKVTSSDVSYVTSRNNWSNNTFYTAYTDKNSNLFSNTFYVVTDDYNVYKCIDNNGGANSTVKPTSTTTSTVKLSDGYKWKYLYTISAADALKFLSTNYMPVKTLTANNGSSQWTVQQAAANGSLEAVLIANAGTGYISTNGTFATVTNSSSFVLAATASGTDDIYNGSTIYIRSGLGSGQIKEVVNYVGSTKTLTVNSAFTITPNTSSQYYVGPKVTISGDGRNASAFANVSSGSISAVNLINNGNNYSYASVAFSANTGTGAVANVSVSPQGGHGADPVEELGGYNVMINVRLTGTESNTFFVNNDFRTVGLVKDPKLASNGSVATSTLYDLTTKLTVNSVSGAFTYDEFVDGGTSGAYGRVVAFANTNASGSEGVLSLTMITGTFSNGESISGNSSSTTASVEGINNRDFKDFDGEVLFVENRPPITRASDAIEDIKLIVRF